MSESVSRVGFVVRSLTLPSLIIDIESMGEELPDASNPVRAEGAGWMDDSPGRSDRTIFPCSQQAVLRLLSGVGGAHYTPRRRSSLGVILFLVGRSEAAGRKPVPRQKLSLR